MEQTATKSVSHGGYGRDTCFDVVQHRYSGGEGGFLEALEILDPPEGKHSIVIHAYSIGRGSVFYECQTVDEAKKEMGVIATLHMLGKWYKDGKGPWLREVACHTLSPWFYAINKSAVMGDFAIERLLLTHEKLPQYKKCIVFRQGGKIAIRKVLGVRQEAGSLMTIIWDDGMDDEVSFWNERCVPCNDPVWQGELLRLWTMLLNGTKTGFKLQSLVLGEIEMSFSIDQEEEEQVVLPEFIVFTRIAKQYPGDPVDEKPKEQRLSTFLTKELATKLIQPKSFLEVLSMLYSEDRCLCPQTCDCQNPPPADENEKEGGVYHISAYCPVHNEEPRPNEDCPLHG